MKIHIIIILPRFFEIYIYILIIYIIQVVLIKSNNLKLQMIK